MSSIRDRLETSSSNTDSKRDSVNSHCSSKSEEQPEPGRSIDFESLPLHPNDPPYSAWGLWGNDDELGTLNHLTPEIVRAASSEIVHGIRVPLK